MKMRFVALVVTSFTAIVCHGIPPAALPPTQILSSNTNGFQGFGASVAIDGDTLVIGAPYTDTFATGAAYVFERQNGNWILKQRLFPPQPLPTFGFFGDNVAIHQNTIVIGVGNESGGPRVSYVYVRGTNNWEFQQSLPTAGQVAIYGDTVVVGNYGAGYLNLTESGLAFVYVRSNAFWSLQQQLHPNDPRDSDYFGIAVAIHGETIVAGAIGDVSTSDESGAAYVFTRQGTNWTQAQKLRASDPQPYADFGRALALRGDLLVVGAPGYLDFYTNSGNAYVFTRNGGPWSQQQKLSPSDPASKDSFGSSVSCASNQILVGQVDRFPRADAAPSGAAYVFKTVDGQWKEQGKLDSNRGSQPPYEVTVASSGDTVLMGNASFFGFAAIYERPVLPTLRRTPPSLTLSFATDSARNYTVESTATLFAPNWSTVTNVIGQGSLLDVPLDTAATQRFYRVLPNP